MEVDQQGIFHNMNVENTKPQGVNLNCSTCKFHVNVQFLLANVIISHCSTLADFSDRLFFCHLQAFFGLITITSYFPSFPRFWGFGDLGFWGFGVLGFWPTSGLFGLCWPCFSSTSAARLLHLLQAPWFLRYP